MPDNNWATAANGCTVTSSSESGGNLDHWTIDGDENTTWLSNSPIKDEWIAYDLGQSRSVRLIRIHHYTTEYPTSFKLQNSADGLDWDDVLTLSGIPEHWINLGTPVSSRYWRLLGLLPDSGGSGWHIYEVEMWDDWTRLTPRASSRSQYLTYAATNISDGNDATFAATYNPVTGEWFCLYYGPDTIREFTAYRLKQSTGADTATAYKFQTSYDGASWTDVYTRVATAPGDETITLTPAGHGRFARILATAGSGAAGWTVYEFTPTETEYTPLSGSTFARTPFWGRF